MNRRNVLATICAIPVLGMFGYSKEMTGKTFMDEDINIACPTNFYKCKFINCRIIDHGFPVKINNCIINSTRVKYAEISRNFKG